MTSMSSFIAYSFFFFPNIYAIIGWRVPNGLVGWNKSISKLYLKKINNWNLTNKIVMSELWKIYWHENVNID